MAALEVGEVNRAKGEDCVLGGKGINVSGVLAQLGCESVALGFVAGETGAWLERGLAAQGLKTDFVHLEQGMTRINVKIKAGQETELNGAGPDIPESAMQELEKKLDSLNEDDILILAGSIPASLSQDTYERLLARLQGRGVRAVVDATRDLLVNVLQYHPFLIKPNNHELGEIVGRVLTTDEEIIAAARTLQQKGARNVLVSMAGDGALLVDENGEVHRIGCPKGKVVNSVGAGDSMVAGFVAGWMQTRSYSFALRLGTACGSATAFSLGLATKEKIDELMKEILPSVTERVAVIQEGRKIMRITELFTAQSIALDEALTDQEQIISRLVELQATHGNITDKDAYKKALYAREAEGSTYVDNGITVPHAKTNVVTRPSLAALRLSSPVQYNAEDSCVRAWGSVSPPRGASRRGCCIPR